MIITVDPDQRFHQRVADALAGSRWATAITAATTVTEAVEVLRGPSTVTAVVGGPGLGLADGVLLAEHAVSAAAGTIVLLVAEPTTEVLRRAMRAGARDVLPPGFNDEELHAALEEAGVGSSGPAPLPGLTVAVFGAKGGVGASVVASNLAVRLAESTGTSVVLADLDLASADLAVLHGVNARWTIQDIADGTVGSDADSLRDVLHPIGDRGARLLPGPVDPALAERINGEDVARLVALLRSTSPIAVLDLATSFDDRTLAAIDAADLLVLTAGLDVASLRGLTVSLRTLAKLGVAADRVRVVIVRADSKAGLTIGDVERTINRLVDVRVPSTRAVPRSVNEGVPLAVSNPRSAVVQAIDELVEDLVGLLPADVPTVDEDEDHAGGALRRLFGRGGSDTVASALPPPVVGEPEADDGPAVMLGDEVRFAAPPDDERVTHPSEDDTVPDQSPRPRVVRRARRTTEGGEVVYLAGDPSGTDHEPDEELASMPPPTIENDLPDDGHHGGRHAHRS